MTGPPPRVFLNSVPKAGTHLLMELVRNLPRMMFSGRHHALRDFSIEPGSPPEHVPAIDLDAFGRVLEKVRNGQFMTAHFPYRQDVELMLEQRGFSSLLILRDPRDVAVSHALYVSGTERHWLHRRYTEILLTPEERLMASITGFPDDEISNGLESIGQRFDQYLGWHTSPNVLVCRFEALVGSPGGGSREEAMRAVRAVAEHLERPLSKEESERMARRNWSQSTATFRRGQIGDWRNHFNEDHREAFKQVAGEVLIRLGYERDLSW
ncbi:MAG: sulfotransferase domain-containing protein [Actinomycetota bacterium]